MTTPTLEPHAEAVLQACGYGRNAAKAEIRDNPVVMELIRSIYEAGARDMREMAAKCCDQRGADEQEGYGLSRGTQNYFRARDAIRSLPLTAKEAGE
jgi:hypothetical protein